MADADLSEGERTVLILNPHWKTVLWPFVLLVVVEKVQATLFQLVEDEQARLAREDR
ncbi:MAG TPA: hypothetical protein VGI05_22460 [Streptosporangiaceae bacterium]